MKTNRTVLAGGFGLRSDSASTANCSFVDAPDDFSLSTSTVVAEVSSSTSDTCCSRNSLHDVRKDKTKVAKNKIDNDIINP